MQSFLFGLLSLLLDLLHLFLLLLLHLGEIIFGDLAEVDVEVYIGEVVGVHGLKIEFLRQVYLSLLTLLALLIVHIALIVF